MNDLKIPQITFTKTLYKHAIQQDRKNATTAMCNYLVETYHKIKKKKFSKRMSKDLEINVD